MLFRSTLWRKVQDEWGNDITNWRQLTEFDAENRQGTKLEMQAAMEHQQDDLTGRDTKVIESQKIVAFVEFAPLNSRFIDATIPYFGDGSRYRYVYAGLCHTRHGEVSRLSDQLSTRLNSHWKKDGEYSVELVSCAGVDKDFDTGIFTTYPERRIRSEIAVPVGGKVALFGQARVAKKPLNNNTYIARVESLDTGEYVDIPVNIKVENQPDRIVEEGASVLMT